MAPRVDWTEESEKKVGEILGRFKLYKLDKPDKLYGLKYWEDLRKYNTFTFSEAESDTILGSLVDILNLEIRNFIISKFSKFKDDIVIFPDKCTDIINYELAGLDGLLRELYFEKGGQDTFRTSYNDKLKNLRKRFKEEVTRIYKEYYDSYSNLVKGITSLSSEIRGYLSIALSLTSLKGFWNKEFRRVWMRFNKINIGDDSIQSKFCEFTSRDIDFFKGDYSFFELLELHKEFQVDELDLKKIYYNYYKGERKGELENLVNKLCSRTNLKNKGKQVYHLLKNFFDSLQPNLLHHELSEDEFKDIYDQFLVENVIMEYELFRVLVNNGYPCIPKVCIFKKDEKGDVKIGEVDVMVLDDDILHLVEITLRRDPSEKEEKLSRIKELLDNEPEGISDFKPCVISNRDKFEEFIRTLRCEELAQTHHHVKENINLT